MTNPSNTFPADAVETWPVDRLNAYERNARKHSSKQIDQLRGSFRQFGQVWPILVREGGTIIAGHGRLEAAKAEGLTEVRVIVARGWSEERCRAFGLLDNKVALNSEWDDSLLGQELAELGQLGLDPSLMGFDPEEVASLSGAGEHTGLTDPDEAPEAPLRPVATRGDLWALGRHRLLCGNSTNPEDVKRALSGVVPHLMVTDPPYGVDYDPAWREGAGLNGPTAAKGKVKNDDQADWQGAWSLFPGDVAYVWHGERQLVGMGEQLIAADFELRNLIVWAKSQLVIGRGHYHSQHETCWYAVRRKGHWAGDRKQTTLWQIEKPRKSETGHSTQKPVECMKRPIENNSSAGHAVYEPFSGSGTTIIAAEMTGRACHAIEIHPSYIDVAINRWQDFTGQKATLDGDGRTFGEIAAERFAKAA